MVFSESGRDGRAGAEAAVSAVEVVVDVGTAAMVKLSVAFTIYLGAKRFA